MRDPLSLRGAWETRGKNSWKLLFVIKNGAEPSLSCSRTTNPALAPPHRGLLAPAAPLRADFGVPPMATRLFGAVVSPTTEPVAGG